MHRPNRVLNTNQWTKLIRGEVNVFLSDQALHDLENEESVVAIYNAVNDLLHPKGIFINGDLIVPEEEEREYVPARLRVSRHLDLMRPLGKVVWKLIGESFQSA